MGVIEKITDKGQTAHLIASTAYGTCDTAAATVDKVATIQGNHSFTLETGVTVHIKFAESNSAPQATLNVNNTGAKLIKRNGDLVIGTSVQGSWMDNSIVALTYDGEYWYLNNTNDVAVASSYYAHAENNGQAIGNGSHAEGEGTRAEGYYSHAEGRKTTASHKSQHVFGEYNNLDDSTATASNRGNYVEIVGNGTGTYARSNARTLDWNGNEFLAGGLTAQTVNNYTLAPACEKDFTASVTSGSADLVTSGGVYNAINSLETVLTGTLTTGNTSLTIQDSCIHTDSLILFFVSMFGVNPTNAVVTEGQIVITFPEQDSDMTVKVIVK